MAPSEHINGWPRSWRAAGIPPGPQLWELYLLCVAPAPSRGSALCPARLAHQAVLAAEGDHRLSWGHRAGLCSAHISPSALLLQKQEPRWEVLGKWEA